MLRVNPIRFIIVIRRREEETWLGFETSFNYTYTHRFLDDDLRGERREGCSSTGNRVELRSNEWISPTRFRAQWKLTPMCGGRGGEGWREETEVEEIGSVTRLTGSICIRFDPLDKLFIALRRAFVVPPPPLPRLALRSLRCCVISGVGSGGHLSIDENESD